MCTKNSRKTQQKLAPESKMNSWLWTEPLRRLQSNSAWLQKGSGWNNQLFTSA